MRLDDIRVDEKLYPRETLDAAHVKALGDNLEAVRERVVVSDPRRLRVAGLVLILLRQRDALGHGRRGASEAVVVGLDAAVMPAYDADHGDAVVAEGHSGERRAGENRAEPL